MGITHQLCHVNMNDARVGIESTLVRVFSVPVWAHFQTKANSHMYYWQNLILHKYNPFNVFVQTVVTMNPQQNNKRGLLALTTLYLIENEAMVENLRTKIT